MSTNSSLESISDAIGLGPYVLYKLETARPSPPDSNRIEGVPSDDIVTFP